MPDFSTSQWCLAGLAAFGVGVSKSGFAGVGLFHVAVFAALFDARQSTGVVLPMLIVGDVLAVSLIRQHPRWDYVRRMLLPTGIGVAIGWGIMFLLDRETAGKAFYGRMIGGIILGLAGLQLTRMWRPKWFGHMPHSWWFAWSLGLATGVSTMVANAAGPIMALYLLAVSLPKLELVGTTAWFFLILNVFKIPFSVSLGLIHLHSLAFNAVLIPAIGLGLFAGRWLIHKVPQRLFDSLLLAFSVVMGLKLMGVV